MLVASSACFCGGVCVLVVQVAGGRFSLGACCVHFKVCCLD